MVNAPALAGNCRTAFADPPPERNTRNNLSSKLDLLWMPVWICILASVVSAQTLTDPNLRVSEARRRVEPADRDGVHRLQ